MFNFNVITLCLVFLTIFLGCFAQDEISVKNSIENSLHKENSFEQLVQEIVIKTVDPFKCIVIVTDPIYIDFFEKTWFGRFGPFLSFFMINLEDNYDSQNVTESYLMMAKNDGCQMYIILVSVGDQVVDLLKFGDKYRLLDSRSQYVILYDNQLFAKNLLYIWKRLINVVFIRRNRGKKAKNGQRKEPWYELSTVPFPSYFTQILVPRRLDIWAKSKFRKGASLFKDKTFDLKNQTLKVAAFSHIPGTVKTEIIVSKSNTNNENNDTGVYFEKEIKYFFHGTEVEIMKAVSKAMNFHLEIYEPENATTELWGRNVNGNFTGILGEMTSARADLAMGDLYYIPYILDIMDLSIPYNVECLTFLTPESLTDISWKTLILPFSPIMWTCVLLCLLVSGAVFHYISIFHIRINKVRQEDRKNNKNKHLEDENVKKRKVVNVVLESRLKNVGEDMKYSLMKEQMQPLKQEDQPEGLYQFSEPINSILYTYSMLLMVSLPKLPTGWSLRMLTGWYWLYCLLVVVAYRASMTAILARPTPRVRIDTLQELIDTKLIYGGWGEINAYFFKSSPEPSLRKIGENFEIVKDSETAVDRVADGTFAFYENTYFLKEASLKRQQRFQKNILGNNTINQTQNDIYDVAKFDRTLHIMQDCVINLPVSLGLQKNSPIKSRVDKLVRRVLEAGLVDKWIREVMQKILINKIQDDIQGTMAIMSLEKFSGALVALGIGYFLGIVALIIELVYFYLTVKRNPHFNKYSMMILQVQPSVKATVITDGELEENLKDDTPSLKKGKKVLKFLKSNKEK